jgi:hypothetical protein
VSVRWLYRVAVGTPDAALDWTVHSDDPKPTSWGSGLLLDGLQVTRKLPDDGVWPCQPMPYTVSFQVGAATAAELASTIRRGQYVAYLVAQWNPDASAWVLAEYGIARITDVDVEARGGYAVATVTAIDPTTMLGEVVLGDEVWPIEAMQNRLNRIMGLVAEEAPEMPSTWDYYSSSDAPAASMNTGASERRPNAATALEIITGLLESWVVGGPVAGGGLDPRYGGYARYVLEAYNADALAAVIAALGLGGAVPFTDMLTVDAWRLNRHTVAPSTRPPAVLGDLGGNVWGVVMTPDGSTFTLSGDEVELPARWAQRIGGVPTTSVVVVPFSGYTAGDGKYILRWSLPQANIRPRVRKRVDAQIEFGVSDDGTYQSGIDAAYQLAFLLIPDTINPTETWGTDNLVWSAAVADGYVRWPFNLGAALTVTDVDPDSHPSGTSWIHGILDAYTIRITDGLPQVTFGTRPQLRDSISSARLTLANVPAGVTLAELDPTMTLEDTRLLRNP